MLTTTLRKILEAEPCYDPRDHKLLPRDHDLDAPISIKEIVEKAGFKDALWCLRSEQKLEELAVRFAMDCADRVRHLASDPHHRVSLCAEAAIYATERANEDPSYYAEYAASYAEVAVGQTDEESLRSERSWQIARLLDLAS